MKKLGLILIVGIVVVLAITAFFLSQNQPSSDLETPVNLAPTEILGQVQAPEGVDPTSLSVISLAGSSDIDSEGRFKAEIRQDGVSVLGAMPEGKEFGLVKVVVITNDTAEESVVLDIQSTAISAVFLTPYFMTNDPVLAQKILAVIETDPKVAALTQVVEQVFNNSDPLSEPQYQQALATAIQSVLVSLNQ